MKIRGLGRFWLALWLACLALPAAMAAPCDALLADGVVEREHVNNTLDLAGRVGAWLCAKRFTSFEAASNAKLEARLPVEQLLVPFGLHKDHRNFMQAYGAFCASATPTDLLVQAGSLKPFVAANQALVDGYLICTRRGELQLDAEPSGDPRNFSLVIRPVAGSTVEIHDIAAAQSDGKAIACRPTLPRAGTTIPDVEQRHLCTRDPGQATTLTIATSEGTRIIRLAAHAHYHIFRDEVAGDSDAVIAQATADTRDSAPICVGGKDGNAALGNYVIDYHQTAGVRVNGGDAHAARAKGSWSFSVKEPTRVCLVAHAAAGEANPPAYKIHYVFYRYRVEKDHHF
jgi:hypothetical protein